MHKIKIQDRPGGDTEFGDFLRVSQVLKARKSPQHFKAELDGLIPREESRAMRLGTMLHMAVLEPAKFLETYTTAPIITGVPSSFVDLKEYCSALGAKPGRSIEAVVAQIKEIEPTFKTVAEKTAEIVGTRSVVSGEDWEMMKKCVDACRAHPVLGEILSAQDIIPENRVFATLEVLKGSTALNPRAKITGAQDAVIPSRKLILEFKRTFDVDPNRFIRHAYNMGWHTQAAVYQQLVSSKYGAEFQFCWVAVEATAPHAVSLIVPDEAVLDAGMMEFRSLVCKIDECAKFDSWPGPSGSFGAVMVALPKWAMDETAERHASDDVNWDAEGQEA